MRGQRIIRSVAYLRPRWPVRLAVGAIFHNEARYLGEWIEFHLAQGVERFYLYDNNSSDDWQAALTPFREVVELRGWPEHPGQFSAYSDCLRRHRRDTRWIAFIDLDEFLFSPTGRPLPEVLGRFGRVAAVVANWRIYGPNDHETPPPGGVVESYPVAEPEDDPVNAHVKSIVFPAMTSTRVENPHFFRCYDIAVGEDGRRVNSAFRRPPTADLLRINHYLTRSRSELQAKMMRPRADIGDVRTHEIYARWLDQPR